MRPFFASLVCGGVESVGTRDLSSIVRRLSVRFVPDATCAPALRDVGSADDASRRRGVRIPCCPMAKKKKTSKKSATATPKAAPAKKGRGGRKPGQWVHLQKDQVAQYRKDAKLSRTKLADLLDVSPTSIQNWETGRSIPVKRFQQRLVELMSGKAPPVEAPSATARKPVAARSSRATTPASSSRAAAPASTDSSAVQVQVTRLSVAGEILRGYLATPQGGKVSPDQLVTLVASLRSALT